MGDGGGLGPLHGCCTLPQDGRQDPGIYLRPQQLRTDCARVCVFVCVNECMRSALDGWQSVRRVAETATEFGAIVHSLLQFFLTVCWSCVHHFI